MKLKPILLITFFTLLLVACSTATTTPEASPTLEGPQLLTVMTHDSFAVSEDVIAAFQDQYNVEVKFVAAGDTGSAVNKAVLSAGSPLADVSALERVTFVMLGGEVIRSE